MIFPNDTEKCNIYHRLLTEKKKGESKSVPFSCVSVKAQCMFQSTSVLLSVLVVLTARCNAARLIKFVAHWPCEGGKTTKAGC